MNRLLLPILLLFACALPAQSSSPVVLTTPIDSGMIARHADGSWSCVLADEGGVSLSTGKSGHDDPKEVQDPAVPVLRMKWVDRNGVEHEVTTPVPSSSEGGIDRAVRTHQRIVEAMQRLYPPRPPA